MPYTAGGRRPTETSEELRARIPGWGADLDPADRPAVPREQLDLGPTGAHWETPEQQPELVPRERSIEHERLPAVFGTAAPLKGVSGAIRRRAYSAYSEARAAHWLLLLFADRVDAVESHLRSFATLRPDNPVTQSGVAGELTGHPWASRGGRGRADLAHLPMDPVIVVGPWLVGAGVVVAVVRVLSRRAGR